MQSAFESAIASLRASGAMIIDAELGSDFHNVNDLKETLMRAEGRAAFLDLWKSRPELVSPERHPNVQGEGLHACDTFYRVVGSAVEAGLPADPSVDALFLLCWSVVHGLACLVLDGPLDVVMPNSDRQAQLRDVLSTFARMIDASVQQAKLRHESREAEARSCAGKQNQEQPALRPNAEQKSAPKAAAKASARTLDKSRPSPRGKKTREERR
jgi:hypothetical protein